MFVQILHKCYTNRAQISNLVHVPRRKSVAPLISMTPRAASYKVELEAIVTWMHGIGGGGALGLVLEKTIEIALCFIVLYFFFDHPPHLD